jgi:hypothetical protein
MPGSVADQTLNTSKASEVLSPKVPNIVPNIKSNEGGFSSNMNVIK